MKTINIGIVAHVDAGKTTLSESLLYEAKAIRSLGRVDHKDSFLDFDVQERSRGITIFAKQAIFEWEDCQFTLLDTPGHVDFSLEMEKTLQVLDAAILLISGLDKVQAHTETIFKLLQYYKIPTYIFVNKMDISYYTKEEMMQDIQKKLSAHCIDFSVLETAYESIAYCNEEMLDDYMQNGIIEKIQIQNAIAQQQVFPVLFGSALKRKNCDALLAAMYTYHIPKDYPQTCSAKVFKVTRDEGVRLVHVLVTGGCLRVKQQIGPSKIDQIRFYSGTKYKRADSAYAGQICCIKGLDHLLSGEHIGSDSQYVPQLVSFMDYEVQILDDTNPVVLFQYLKQMEDEEPQLQVKMKNQVITMQLMGAIQIEVLKKQVEQRFQVRMQFNEGQVIYKETIINEVEGVGHYEPIGHYAEVHVLLTPLPRNSGMQYENECVEGLSKIEQQQIMQYMQSKEHYGRLVKGVLCDVKITLLGGKSHLKHTQPMDLKEACQRAINQGLMKCESQLLEPYYQFRIETECDYVSTIIYDLDTMQATYSVDYNEQQDVIISGKARVSSMNHYQTKLLSITKGSGKMILSHDGYDASKEQDEIVKQIDYDAVREVNNPSGSIFFAQGAGFYVPYDEVEQYMHIPLFRKENKIVESEWKRNPYTISNQELNRVMSKVFASPKTISKPRVKKQVESYQSSQVYQAKPLCIIVDGYNLIFDWPYLNELATYQLESARNELINMLSNYQGFKKCKLIVVFDAYKVEQHREQIYDNQSITIVYTKKAQTADQYIEMSSKQLKKDYQIQVATSDALEQMIVLGQGAIRMSAAQFYKEIMQMKQRHTKEFNSMQRKNRHTPLSDIKKFNEQ